MYEKNNGSGMSLDALLSQAGIPPEEVLEMLPDADGPSKTPEEKKAEALKSAAALADLPGMPGFLKPTRTSLAAEAARMDEEDKQRQAAEGGTATATVDATDNNGQGFKVTVMVSPDDETAKEAAALRESATASKPEPSVFSPYGNGAGIDGRYYPQNQAAGSGFGGVPPTSVPLGGFGGANSLGFGAGYAPSFGASDSMSFGPRSDLSAAMPVPGMDAPGVFPSSDGGFGAGAVTYDPASFSAVPNGFASFDQGAHPLLGGDGLGLPADGVPLTDEEAAARAAAAQAAMAAQNAAMIDTMVQYGPDAIPEDDKKRFFGKKKREKEAMKAAEEAAAFAAATAAAAAEAAAAEEAARHQPTAYIPAAPPIAPAPMAEPFNTGSTAFDAPVPDMMGTTQMPLAVPQAAVPMEAAGQPGVDMSGYDQFASPLPNASGMGDPSVTTGMPVVGAVMGPDGAYLADPTASPLGYDQYGYGADASGVTPEGVAALEAMRSEMNDASDSHRKRIRTIKIVVGSVVGVIVAAVITFIILVATNVISLDDLGIHINNEVPQGVTDASSSASNALSYHSASSSSSSSASSSSAASDSGSSSGTTSGQAGDEVYHYTLTTIDGEHPQVTEVVTYGDDGYCIQTAMDAVFSTATAAQAFVERVRSDYGTNFLSGSVDGTTAHVVVNMERAKLTREGYENALRGVVDGLEIERLT